MSENNNNQTTERPPVVAIMGHIDHGKSTLLDYIRKTNIVDKEIGGITQNISAYEVIHKDEKGQEKKITFLDTPGHEAFSKMRTRGASLADIAILVVSAEDGVKPQTIEAYKTIEASKTPYIVAINKIDKPNANIEKTKIELAENEIYLENYGGKVPFVAISAKVGTGIDELLSLILLVAEMENLTGNKVKEASGFSIESNLDQKRGIVATLLIKQGTLKKGMFVAVEDAICTVKMMENFKGQAIDEATFSSPVRIFGFDKIPKVGAMFESFTNKKDLTEYLNNWQEINTNALKANRYGAPTQETKEKDKKIIPILIKADVSGSLEAIEKEISKINCDSAVFKLIGGGIGSICLSDIKSISDSKNVVIVGFNVKADKSATEEAEKRGIEISHFNIIYKLNEWLVEELEKRRPRVETLETIGKAKIIRAFSRTKERQIVGGKVTEGSLLLNGTVKIMRRDFEIGKGRIVNLEKGKVKTSTVEVGTEFGMMVESKIEIVAGDILELFSIAQK